MIGGQLKKIPQNIISTMVVNALAEDIQTVDLSAQIILPTQNNNATIITREKACICGTEWLEQTFLHLTTANNLSNIKIEWYVTDGQIVEADTVLCHLYGNTRCLLTGERTALNFLQTLSATATAYYIARQYIEGNTKLLDTRKTIPNMRLAQKYAIACAGGYNHRLGLYDAFLIKENHIMAAGTITAAVKQAKNIDNQVEIEVEVENLEQLSEAIQAGADIVMLDNFTLESIIAAIEYNKQQPIPVKLEVSGNIEGSKITQLSKLGIDFISSGALTKNIKAIDLSMRIQK